MAGEDIVSYTDKALMAYQDALNQAKFTQNALLRQYGFKAPDATGQYTTEGAQAAFDPNTLFDKATGGIDKAKLSSLAANLSVGGTGRLADVMRSGVSAEADVATEMAQRGFSPTGMAGAIGGGLVSQRRQLAEQLAAGELGATKSAFIGDLAQSLSPISGAYQDVKSAEIQDRLLAEEAAAYKNSLAMPVDVTATSVSTKPTLSAGPSGDFMTKFKATQAAGSGATEIANLKELKNSYALSGQQLNMVNSRLKKLGVKV